MAGPSEWGWHPNFLGMAEKTFESHMSHIFEKLELSTRAELTRRAQEQTFEEQGFDW